MTRAKTCTQCGGATDTTRGSHLYTESGLGNVTLLNIDVHACGACGARELVIPRLPELHQLIAGTVGTQPRRLGPLMYSFRFDHDQTMWLWSVESRGGRPAPKLPS
jgi:hypothetical protein